MSQRTSTRLRSQTVETNDAPVCSPSNEGNMAPKETSLQDILTSITAMDASIQKLSDKIDDQAKVLDDQSEANIAITNDLAAKMDAIKLNMASTNDQLNNLDRNRVTQQAYIAKLEAHMERLTNEICIRKCIRRYISLNSLNVNY